MNEQDNIGMQVLKKHLVVSSFNQKPTVLQTYFTIVFMKLEVAWPLSKS